MTTPDEEIRALKQINKYLVEVIRMKTVKERKEAISRLLRHYPADHIIERQWKKRKI